MKNVVRNTLVEPVGEYILVQEVKLKNHEVKQGIYIPMAHDPSSKYFEVVGYGTVITEAVKSIPIGCHVMYSAEEQSLKEMITFMYMEETFLAFKPQNIIAIVEGLGVKDD